MLIHKSFKTELDLTPEQEVLCRKHIGARRFVYNWMLAQCIFAKENKLPRPSIYDLIKKFRAEVKPTLEWYSEISAKTEEGAARDLDRAYKHFFRRIKSGKKGKSAGFPKFKKKRDGIGSFYTNTVVVTEKSIRVLRVGWLKLKERGYIPINTHISNATISTRGGKWFISCQGEIEIAHIEKDGVIGVDLGIKHAVVTSDSDFIDAPKPIYRYARKLRRLNKSLSRKTTGSNRRKIAVRKLSKLHYRISNIRSDFIHKATTELAKTKQVIVIENLNVSGMMKNRHIARAVGDIGFYEIRRQLEYKMKWYGGELIVADRFYPSSKLCNVCGYKNDNLKLSDRDWICPQCGAYLDRDVNAAMNLAALAPKIEESLNGRGDGSSVDVSNDTAQPVCETSTCTCIGSHGVGDPICSV